MSNSAAAISKPVITKKRSLDKNLIYGLLFVSPVLLGFLIFTLGPLLFTFILSLTNYSPGVKTVNFVGLSNYIEMFTGKDIFFFPSVKATFYYVALSVPCTIIFSFFMSVVLNMKIQGRAFFRGAFYLPMVIPLASSGMIWLWMLEPNFGIINNILRAIGIPPSTWLISDTTVIPTFVLMSLWLCGNTIVIFLAALQDIPTQLYEAIDVDGGTPFHKLFYITIPMISPVIFFNTVMGFINAFQTFVQPAVMTSGASGNGQALMGGPNNSSLLAVLYIYEQAFRFSKMGTACAASALLFIVIMISTALIFRVSKSWVYYGGDVKKNAKKI